MRTPPGCEKNTCLRKGLWTAEEDQKLVSYINRYGIWNWSHMPKFAGLLRSGKSCRLRWMNYLKPNLKRGNFSKEEEEIILHSQSLLGNRWSAIATRLPGRSDKEIKNYWYTHLKKRKTKDSNISRAFDTINDHTKNTPQQLNLQTSTFEDERSPSTSTTSSSLEQELLSTKHHYYDIGSPGTVEDLQWFWKQLCPIQSLEFRNYNYHQDSFSDHMVLQNSVHDSVNHDFGK